MTAPPPRCVLDAPGAPAVGAPAAGAIEHSLEAVVFSVCWYKARVGTRVMLSHTLLCPAVRKLLCYS